MRNDQQQRDNQSRERGNDRSDRGSGRSGNWQQGREQHGAESGRWSGADSGRYEEDGFDGSQRDGDFESSDRGGRGGMEGTSSSDRETFRGGSMYGDEQSWRGGSRGQERSRYGGDGDRSNYGSYGSQSGQQQRGIHSGKGPKGYRRSDERIKEDVSEALTRDGDLDASNIEVEVSGGEVTLSGTVTDKQMKRRAEECAESVSGVEHVQNNVRADNKQQRDGDSSGAGMSSGSSGKSASRSANGSTNANSTSGNSKGQQSSAH